MCKYIVHSGRMTVGSIPFIVYLILTYTLFNEWSYKCSIATHVLYIYMHLLVCFCLFHVFAFVTTFPFCLKYSPQMFTSADNEAALCIKDFAIVVGVL